MYKIKDTLLTRLRQDESLQLDIAKAMVRKFSTIKTWVRDNDPMLGSKAVVLVIKDLTGLNENEIVETELVAAQ